MKRVIQQLVFMLCLAIVLSTLSLPAFADPGINNTIKGSGNQVITPVANGKSLLHSASNGTKIEQPNAVDYFSAPFSLYVNAPKGHSVYAYDYWNPTTINNIGTVFHGSRVTVLAEHGDYYCVLFQTENYVLRAAWVYAEYLVSWYPGYKASIDRGGSWITYNDGDPALKWSKENFVGTKRKFSILETPVYNCAGFTLDYQVTSRNGVSTDSVLGPRNIYVNDGSGWTYVGSFNYDDTYACHVDITLYEPITLYAVATIADCAEPDTFVFRQSVLDVRCAY